MKRELKRCDRLYRHNPLFFWSECCMCHEEFRRENGWMASTYPIINGEYTTIYICESCAPNRKIAEDIICEEKYYPEFPGFKL